MIKNRESLTPVSPKLLAVRLYTIYVLIAATLITAVLLITNTVLKSELYVIMGVPPVLLLLTGPYFLILLVALRRRRSPFARWIYAIAATVVPLPGIAYWLRLTFFDPPKPYGGHVVLKLQYFMALFFVSMGIAVEIVGALHARKQQRREATAGFNDKE